MDRRRVHVLVAVEHVARPALARKPLPDGLGRIASHNNLPIAPVVPAVAEVVAVLRFPLFPLYKHVYTMHEALK